MSPWKKRQSGGDVGPIGGRASVSEPADEGKRKQHDEEDFEKYFHDTVGNLWTNITSWKDLGPSGAPSFGNSLLRQQFV